MRSATTIKFAPKCISIDNSENAQYSKRNIYIPYSEIGEETISQLRKKICKIYENFDNIVADDIAIVHNKTVYIIDSGKDNGKLSFGIRERHNISDSDLRNEYVRLRNGDAISNGYVSNELFARLGNEHDQHRGSNIGREAEAELSNNSTTTEHKESRVFGKNETDGEIDNTQYSLRPEDNSYIQEAISRNDAVQRSYEHLSKKNKEIIDKRDALDKLTESEFNSVCSVIESKTDKKGNIINGSKKKEVLKLLNQLSLSKAEKIIILAYLGYSVSEYSQVLRRYVAGIGLSKSQQKALLAYCDL